MPNPLIKKPSLQKPVNKNGGVLWSQCKPSDLYNAPADILRLINKVFGQPLFDPCPENPQEDGLSIPWQAKTYFNPPYSAPMPWVQKALAEVKAGNVEEFVFLAKLDPSTDWWKAVQRLPVIYCLLNKRIKFHHQIEGTTNSAPFPTVLIYYGRKPAEFAKVMSNVGQIMFSARLAE